MEEKKMLRIWGQNHTRTSSDEERATVSVPVLQLEEVAVDKFAIGKSCGVLVAQDQTCYQVGEPRDADLTLSGIEATLREISLLKTHHVKDVSCGYHHIAILTESGAAFCWGTSNYGQCGVVADMVTEPRIVLSGKEENLQFLSIACGKNHTMAISTTHELWGWGSSEMIGGTSATKKNSPRPKPEIVEHLCGRKVLQVSCGKFHTVALTEKIAKRATQHSEFATVCPVCKQDTFKMYDTDDQVIISDTHYCACREKRSDSDAITDTEPSASPKVKTQTHNRSASLPFFKRSASPLIARKERLSKTPPSLPLLSIAFANAASSESLPSTKSENINPELGKIEMLPMPKSSMSDSGHHREKDSDEGEESCYEQKLLQPNAVTGNDRNVHTSLQKSRSTPADLCKEGICVNGDVPHFPCKLEDGDSDPYSESLSRSHSPSMASLYECKSRMTLPVSSEMPVNMDPELAMAYLNRLSPDIIERHDDVQNPQMTVQLNHADAYGTSAEELPGTSSEVPEKNTNGETVMMKSFSERITQSFTDNQLLSPLTSYSKNVFTGVMDRIEWIKTSTYDKGVAPIREFLTKEKMPTKDARDEDNGPHDDPLRSETSTSSHEMYRADNNKLTLRTEVWAWGKNSDGQLGLADQLNRLQPTCVKALSSRGIVKISCGSNHTVALTSNSEVFSWGCNEYGQLGRNDSNTGSPVKLESKNRVWDIAAGRHHTLFLQDSKSQEPQILICGCDMCNKFDSPHPLKPADKKASNAWKIRPIDFSHKMGFHSRVITGFSTLSSSISENNPAVSTIALHNFAKKEREFYQQVTLVKTEVLRPLKFSDLFKHLEGSAYGDVLLQICDLFGQLSYEIGLNTVQLTRAVVTAENCRQETFFYISNSLLEKFRKYFKCLNNVIAYGFFEKCEDLSVKQCKFLSKSPIAQAFKKLLGEKRLSKHASENFLQVLQFPAFRLREYSTILNKLAVALEEDVPLSSFLEELSAQSEELWSEINGNLNSANSTRGFWRNEFKSAKLGKLAEPLKKIGRYLIIHSKKFSLDVAHSGRFSSNWFILFNDCLVLIHNGAQVTYPLEMLWCYPVSDTDDKSHHIKISTPEDDILAAAPTEESKAKWITSLNRAVNNVISKNHESPKRNDESKQFHRSPPSTRHASYTFIKDQELKGAAYTGAWLDGKPHGRGEMTWPDGRNYKGNYKNGKEDGCGEWKAAPDDTSRLKYHGWWKEGKMNGYGKLWYNRYQAYDGNFISGVREGHGTLRIGSVTEGSVYVGAWKNNQKSGFGIEDNITKGEKYLGMWVNDERHGVGLLVTLDGLYIQCCFSHGNISGDTLLIEGRYVFEGHLAPGLLLSGKGRLTLPSGDKIEGSFSGSWSENIRISGNFINLEQTHSSNRPESPKSPIESSTIFSHRDHAKNILRRYNRHIMKKLATGKHAKVFPLTLHPDLKWTQIFLKCRTKLSCPLKDQDSEKQDTRKIWEALSVSMSNAKRMQQELKQGGLSPQKKVDETKLSWLERVPSVVMENKSRLTSDDIEAVKEYLSQAFSTTLHPLGELAESLGTVFRDSYSGAGAHTWLLTQAVADVRSFVRRAYEILWYMFPLLGKEHNASHMKIVHNHTDEGSEDDFSTASDETVTAGDLLLPVLLPRVYPTLFTLYALRHEAEDRSYWERVTRLNRHPDIALLSFLGVKPKFWLLDEKEIPPLESSPEDGQLYESLEQAESSKWRHLLVARAKDCSFLSAVETLQLISTTFIPAEKLNVIQSTFKEINATVFAHHRKSHTWSMDDLFPVFQYVVIRARISHLGCEIQLIEDFLEPDLCKGEKGIMFTTLKACYFQIRVEKNL